MSPTKNCQFCQSPNLELEFSCFKKNQEFFLIKCKSCNFVRAFPEISKKALSKLYQQSYGYEYMFSGQVSKRDEEDIRLIESHLGKFSRRESLLDVGCGTGIFTNLAEQQGFRALGLDWSVAAIGHGRKNFGANLHCQDFLEFSTNRRFDVITIRHFIEHVFHPELYLQKARKVLRPGGMLFIETPNYQSLASKLGRQYWQWMTPPIHVSFFSPDSFRRILEQAGFEIIEIRTRRGGASSLLFAMLFILLGKLGLIRHIRANNYLASRPKREEKMLELIDLIGILFSPLEDILNRSGMGSEVVVMAKKYE